MGLALDAFIIFFYFALIIAIGLYKGRKEESLEDFALGGRQIPWWAVMASIIAAETSAATFLGAPGEGYEKRSIIYVQLVIGLIIGRFIVGNAFLKPYYQYKVYTVYDYLGIRFGPKTKSYVSGLFLIMRTLASGTRLFVPSLVMVLAWRMFTGGSVQFSQNAVTTVWPYFVAITGLTIVTCIYTALGGIKAVIWTDVVQACLMYGGALVAMGTLIHHIGGLGSLAQYAPKMLHLDGYFVTGFEGTTVAEWMTTHHLTSMGIWDYIKLILGSEYTVFSAVIGTTLANMAAFGTDQDMVQRMLTAETYKKARRSLMTAAIMDLPIAATFTFIGVLLYIYFQKDPTFRPAANSDVFGSFILNVMPAGIRGLVLAGIFATAMGSFSAALNALATSAVNDWYIRLKPGKTDEEYVAAAKWFTLIFAVLMVLVATGFAYAKVTDPKARIIPVVLGIAGYILGPMLGVFLIGMFTKNRGSDKGNLFAVSVGLITTTLLGGLAFNIANFFWTALGNPALQKPEWMGMVSFTWFAMIGAIVVFTVGCVFKTPEETLESAMKRMQEGLASETP